LDAFGFVVLAGLTTAGLVVLTAGFAVAFAGATASFTEVVAVLGLAPAFKLYLAKPSAALLKYEIC
jgi:hypothetical protein